MRRLFQFSGQFIGLMTICGLSAFGQHLPADLPAVMTRIEVRLQSTEIPEGSFASKPKVLYRATNRYCRTEELPDPQTGIHGLMIINEPEIWMVNRLRMEGRHQVDGGPVFNCLMPMFSGEGIKSAADLKNPLLELEFGHELEYFQGKGAQRTPGPVLCGQSTAGYMVVVGDPQLFLFTAGTPERPGSVVRQQGKLREIYWYDAYEQLPFNPHLFAPPAGVKIEEVKP